MQGTRGIHPTPLTNSGEVELTQVVQATRQEALSPECQQAMQNGLPPPPHVKLSLGGRVFNFLLNRRVTTSAPAVSRGTGVGALHILILLLTGTVVCLTTAKAIRLLIRYRFYIIRKLGDLITWSGALILPFTTPDTDFSTIRGYSLWPLLHCVPKRKRKLRFQNASSTNAESIRSSIDSLPVVFGANSPYSFDFSLTSIATYPAANTVYFNTVRQKTLSDVRHGRLRNRRVTIQTQINIITLVSSSAIKEPPGWAVKGRLMSMLRTAGVCILCDEFWRRVDSSESRPVEFQIWLSSMVDTGVPGTTHCPEIHQGIDFLPRIAASHTTPALSFHALQRHPVEPLITEWKTGIDQPDFHARMAAHVTGAQPGRDDRHPRAQLKQRIPILNRDRVSLLDHFVMIHNGP